jgi:hypothetical protein
MRRSGLFGALVVLGAVVVIASGVALVQVQPARAQCGSQASSCKNCHETQLKKPVNNDGTGWHQSHAFGDFCYICHGGNNQAAEETAAHSGMVSPLADIKVACGQCHPNDLQPRAAVYVAKLGAPLPAQPGAQTTAAATAVPTATQAPAAQSAPPPPSGNTSTSSNLTDYVARYNQSVLHRQPTNWGNVILVGVLILLVLGGALFVNRREGWVSISFTEKRTLDKELPADVAAIASQVAELSGASRKSLANLLQKPAAAQLLAALDKLSTDDASGDGH